MNKIEGFERHYSRCLRIKEIDWDAPISSSSQQDKVPPGEVVLKIDNLKKYYEVAANALFGSSAMYEGQIFCLLGHNGAGKTTAISMVMRSLYPTAGTVHIEGKSVLSNFQAGAKHLGIVAQHNTLWDKLSCRDHLRLFARLRGVEIASSV